VKGAVVRTQPHRCPLFCTVPHLRPALLEVDRDTPRVPLEDLATRVCVQCVQCTLERVECVRHTLCTTCVHVIVQFSKSTARVDKTVMAAR